MQRHLKIFVVMGVLCFASLAISAWCIVKQLRIARLRVGVRGYTIRILLMVPIYSTQVFVALVRRFEQANEILELFRKLYECVCIFAFLQLLVSHLGGLDQIVSRLDQAHCRHVWPVSMLVRRLPQSYLIRESYPRKTFVTWTLKGVVQYVWVSLICAAIGFVTFFVRPLHPLWIAVVKPVANVCIMASQMPAMYCLVLFYHANEDRLTALRPIQKLLSIKILVFFTVWQGFIIHFANHLHAFKGFAEHSQSHWNESEISEAILNCLLLIEMLILSCAHHYVYPPQENADLFQPSMQMFSIDYSTDWKERMQARLRLYDLESTDTVVVTGCHDNAIEVSWVNGTVEFHHDPMPHNFPLKFEALDPDPTSTCRTSEQPRPRQQHSMLRGFVEAFQLYDIRTFMDKLHDLWATDDDPTLH